MGLTTELGNQLKRGSTYLACQAFSIRAVTIVVHFWLAAILSREDFGKLAIATSIVAIFDVSALLDVPMSVARLGGKARRLVRSAIAASAIAGTASIGIILLIAFAGAQYSSNLASSAMVIAIAAATLPSNSIHNCCISLLRSRFQFRAATVIESTRILAAAVASIAFAYAGFGATSVVLPQLLFSIAMLPVTLRYAWPECDTARPSRVRYVLAKGASALPGNFAVTCTRSLDNLIVSSFFSLRETGRYFFAYSLSVQSINLLGPIAQQALVPVLSRLPSPQQRSLEFAKLLTQLSRYLVPLCFIQAGALPFVISLMYGDKWEGAELLILILSIAMGVRVVGLMAGTLFKLNGAYSTLSTYNVLYGILFTVFVFASTQTGSLVWVCLSLLAFYSFVSVFHFWNAIRHHVEHSGSHVANAFLPVVTSSTVFGLAFVCSKTFNADFLIASAIGASSVFALVVTSFFRDRLSANTGNALSSRNSSEA